MQIKTKMLNKTNRAAGQKRLPGHGVSMLRPTSAQDCKTERQKQKGSKTGQVSQSAQDKCMCKWKTGEQQTARQARAKVK